MPCKEDVESRKGGARWLGVWEGREPQASTCGAGGQEMRLGKGETLLDKATEVRRRGEEQVGGMRNVNLRSRGPGKC